MTVVARALAQFLSWAMMSESLVRSARKGAISKAGTAFSMKKIMRNDLFLNAIVNHEA
ncbi:hypothetical protein [Mesorhizobium sp. M1027]|uniref:hypothetical protein n=1 Tax=Mesorhizobium sp. M1027 TaxID=2957050 RepID=UPI00333D7CED